MEKGHEIVVPYPQRCDFCDHAAAYDGRTALGSWAWMCHRHFDIHGPGRTGTGFAQRIVKEKA